VDADAAFSAAIGVAIRAALKGDGVEAARTTKKTAARDDGEAAASLADGWRPGRVPRGTDTAPRNRPYGHGAASTRPRPHGHGAASTRAEEGTVRRHTRDETGQFALLGVDFLLGDDGTPYLIEFSKAPGIRDVPPFLGAQNRALVRDALDLALAARAHWLGGGGAGLRTALEPVRGGWRFIEVPEL